MNTSVLRWVGLAFAILVIAAWVDGGEEPLRTIDVPVSVPVAAVEGAGS